MIMENWNQQWKKVSFCSADTSMMIMDFSACQTVSSLGSVGRVHVSALLQYEGLTGLLYV